jgi:two-component system chemotaxis sensor kinase CheA
MGDDQSAVPLADIARLEQIPVANVERSKGQSVVQYRGEILPLIGLAEALGQYGSAETGTHLPVLVHTMHGRLVGLVVQSIVDITEADVDRREASGFVTGTAVVGNRVTDVIDTSALLESLLGVPNSMYEDNYNEMTVV